MKRSLLILGILIAIVIAVFLFPRIGRREESGDLRVSGNVEVTEVNVGFKIPGRVVRLLIDEGDRVQKNQKLALLDHAELESYVAMNRARLSEMQAQLAELRTGVRPQELEKARAEVNHREAELTKSAKDHERAKMLYSQGAMSAQQMEALEKAFQVARSQHQQALETLSLAKEGPRIEEIRAQENRVAQAEAALRASEERLKDTIINSPISGVILEKDVETGETVSPGVPVYTIGDMENPWIKVYVKEDKLGHVKLGQKAEVTVDSYPEKTYQGTVSYIASEAEFTPKNVQTQEERVKLVFGVKVKVKNENNELKPGMPADVRIFLK